MKKFFALCLCFCLSLSVISFPTYACEVVAAEDTSVTMSVVDDNEIMPRVVTELWKTDGVYLVDSMSVRVTPQKGCNLKLVINASDVCKIEVTKNGGWWPSNTVTYQAGSGTVNIDLINNCNGEPYTVKFTNNSGVFIVARLVQTEYI